MKKYILLALLLFHVVIIYAKREISAIKIIFSPIEYKDKKICDFYNEASYCSTINFDFGIKESVCDTIEITNTDEINKLIGNFDKLQLSTRHEIDTYGKIIIKFNEPWPRPIWVYWGPADLQIGNCGNVYNMPLWFADALNEIFRHYTGKLYFDSGWYSWIKSAYK